MPKKPKVALLFSAPAPYREPFLKRLAARDEIDLEVIFLSKVCGEFDWSMEFECDYPHTFLELPDWMKYKNYPQWVHPELRKKLKNGNYDAVVISGYFLVSQIYTAIRCMLKGVPYVFWSESHAKGIEESFLRKLFRRLLIEPLLKRAGGHIAVGGFAREKLVSCGVDFDKVSIVPNAPDVCKWAEEAAKNRPRKSEIRKELGIDDKPLLLYVGRMVSEKGVDELIEAVGILQDKNAAEFNLLMVGRGPLLDELKRKVEEKGLKRVYFTGFVSPENLYPYFAASDFFVLPSRYEPFGAVVQEAAASGLPIIVSDTCGAASELLVDGENGFSFRAGDSSELAKAIEKTISLKDKFGSMGEKSGELAKRYDYSYCEEQFISAINRCMGGRRC